ncbi:Gfo/Idh/MocA family protein [Humidisolicoccus flavus]|uniref:Gfo/Idh/MocA family protein n=1 Tax=Humidisolicoccus flavus TaxID=3111414 RepID=UPI0032431883
MSDSSVLAPSGLGWGILGPGGIAKSFVTDLIEGGRSVAAVGSRSQDSADAFAAQFSIERAHSGYEQLVADPSVDIVYIATPNPFHHEQALLAIAAGKHVLIEKPVALNASQAREIFEAAAAAGVVAMEAMWTRFLPHMSEIRQRISDGVLGELSTVHADLSMKLSADPKHRINNPDLGGGALLDLGVYPISLALHFLGAPSRVLASGILGATGVDERVSLILEHAAGTQSVVTAASQVKGASRAMIAGTDARIELGNRWHGPTSFSVIDADDNLIEEVAVPHRGRGMLYQALEVERLVRTGGGQSEIMSNADSIDVMETLDAARAQFGLRFPGE